ncbi:hypothetical protein NMY22_g17853 [Coprinellus aureogranulatus]|nr:hypothetical protein NMY22_g17853 [Coprinellus aureogranulatus]
MSMCLDIWHADLYDFLQMKRASRWGEEGADKLSYALMVGDLFMERVASDRNWTLFCPTDAPELCDKYGDDFKVMYEGLEASGVGRKTVRARSLLDFIVNCQIESGGPSILFKDAINRKSNERHLGTIRQSSLSAEITQYASQHEHQEKPYFPRGALGFPGTPRDMPGHVRAARAPESLGVPWDKVLSRMQLSRSSNLPRTEHLLPAQSEGIMSNTSSTPPPPPLYAKGDKVVLHTNLRGKVLCEGNVYDGARIVAANTPGIFIGDVWYGAPLTPPKPSGPDPKGTTYRLHLEWNGTLNAGRSGSYEDGDDIDVKRVVWAKERIPLGRNRTPIEAGTPLMIQSPPLSKRTQLKLQSNTTSAIGEAHYKVSLARLRIVKFTWISEDWQRPDPAVFTAA